MTLDIRGSLKNTKISSDGYVVLEELISNSIDAFLIRQHQDPAERSLEVSIEVDINTSGLLGDGTDVAITCTDNGCGFGNDQTDAFLTKDTSYKDDLAIAGIGKCRGAGRIQYFHHFERAGIRSTYRSGSDTMTRTLPSRQGGRR
jgi:sensor histidine kinase regulating citrate/malate metabolism